MAALGNCASANCGRADSACSGVIWFWAFAIGITLVLINLFDLVRKKKPEDKLHW